MLGLCLGFVTVNASPASADVSLHVDFLRNWATGRCLDSNSSGALYVLPCQEATIISSGS